MGDDSASSRRLEIFCDGRPILVASITKLRFGPAGKRLTPDALANPSPRPDVRWREPRFEEFGLKPQDVEPNHTIVIRRRLDGHLLVVRRRPGDRRVVWMEVAGRMADLLEYTYTAIRKGEGAVGGQELLRLVFYKNKGKVTPFDRARLRRYKNKVGAVLRRIELTPLPPKTDDPKVISWPLPVIEHPIAFRMYPDEIPSPSTSRS